MSNRLRSPSAKVKSQKAPDKPRDSDRAVIDRWYRSRDYRPLAVVLEEARRERESQR